MADKFQSIKGFYDILPEATPLWFKLEDTARSILSQYGYNNIRMPIVESTDLFVRSVGEHTDIVEKEMYAWTDALNGDRLTLRPDARRVVCGRWLRVIWLITARNGFGIAARCFGMKMCKKAVNASFTKLV